MRPPQAIDFRERFRLSLGQKDGRRQIVLEQLCDPLSAVQYP